MRIYKRMEDAKVVRRALQEHGQDSMPFSLLRRKISSAFGKVRTMDALYYLEQKGEVRTSIDDEDEIIIHLVGK